jgi:hypothetical protein
MDTEKIYAEKLVKHYAKMGTTLLVCTVGIFAICIWFFDSYFNFTHKNYNPEKDEKIVNIQYGFEDSSYVFMTFAILTFVLFLAAGLVFLIGQGDKKYDPDYNSLVIVTSVLSGIFSFILFVNSGVSFQNKDIVGKNFSDAQKKLSSDTLDQKTVPYTEIAVTSLIVALISVTGLVIILVIQYTNYPQKETIEKPISIPLEKKNYLANDTVKI